MNVFTRRCLREHKQCLATVKKYYASLLIYSHCVEAKQARKQEWINSLRLWGMIHNRDRQYHISLQYLHLVHTIRFLPPTYQVGVRNLMKGGGGCRACRGCASRFSIWITPSPIDPSAQASLHTWHCVLHTVHWCIMVHTANYTHLYPHCILFHNGLQLFTRHTMMYYT